MNLETLTTNKEGESWLCLRNKQYKQKAEERSNIKNFSWAISIDKTESELSNSFCVAQLPTCTGQLSAMSRQKGLQLNSFSVKWNVLSQERTHGRWKNSEWVGGSNNQFL